MPANKFNSNVQSQLDNQLGFVSELARQTYDSARRLNELHVQFAQQMLEDSLGITRQIMASSDPFQWSALLVRQLGPFSERLQHYQRGLIGLLSGVPVDFTRTTESFMPAASRGAAAMAEDMARRADDARQALVGRTSDGAATPLATNGSGQPH